MALSTDLNILCDATVAKILDNPDGSKRWGYIAVHDAVVKMEHPGLMKAPGDISPAARKIALARKILASINNRSVTCGRCKTVLIASDPATPLECGSCGFDGRPYINSLMAIAQNNVAKVRKRAARGSGRA